MCWDLFYVCKVKTIEFIQVQESEVTVLLFRETGGVRDRTNGIRIQQKSDTQVCWFKGERLRKPLCIRGALRSIGKYPQMSLV